MALPLFRRTVDSINTACCTERCSQVWYTLDPSLSCSLKSPKNMHNQEPACLHCRRTSQDSQHTFTHTGCELTEDLGKDCWQENKGTVKVCCQIRCQTLTQVVNIRERKSWIIHKSGDNCFAVTVSALCYQTNANGASSLLDVLISKNTTGRSRNKKARCTKKSWNPIIKMQAKKNLAEDGENRTREDQMQAQEAPTNQHQEGKKDKLTERKEKTMSELTWNWLTNDTQVCTENQREENKDGKCKANMTHEERNKIMQEITQPNTENQDDAPACQLNNWRGWNTPNSQIISNWNSDTSTRGFRNDLNSPQPRRRSTCSLLPNPGLLRMFWRSDWTHLALRTASAGTTTVVSRTRITHTHTHTHTHT